MTDSIKSKTIADIIGERYLPVTIEFQGSLYNIRTTNWDEFMGYAQGDPNKRWCIFKWKQEGCTLVENAEDNSKKTIIQDQKNG